MPRSNTDCVSRVRILANIDLENLVLVLSVYWKREDLKTAQPRNHPQIADFIGVGPGSYWSQVFLKAL